VPIPTTYNAAFTTPYYRSPVVRLYLGWIRYTNFCDRFYLTWRSTFGLPSAYLPGLLVYTRVALSLHLLTLLPVGFAPTVPTLLPRYHRQHSRIRDCGW